MLTDEQKEAMQRAEDGNKYLARLDAEQKRRALRDLFAGQALASMSGCVYGESEAAVKTQNAHAADIARMVYSIADAMLAERERTER